MFGRFYRLIDNVQKLNQDFIFVRVIENNDYLQEYIIDLNRIDQLFEEGIDVEGTVIGEYAAATENLNFGETYAFGGDTTPKAKIAGEPIFLLDTNDFYVSFDIDISGDGFTITADTKKADADLADFGKILGLTDESKNKLVKEILPLVIEETRRILLS